MIGELFSEREAARELGLRLDQLRHEVNTGRITYLGTRSKPRYTLEELRRWWALYRSRPWIKPAP